MTVPFLVLPFNNEPNARSELDPRNYRHLSDYFQVIGQAIWPSNRTSFSEGTLICYPDNHETESNDSEWFFINGLATSPPMAILNCKELARAFKRPIRLIHNPTLSAVVDILHSFKARTLRKDGSLSRNALRVVKQSLIEKDKVVLIGHSQGTIVNSYIVRKLLKDPAMHRYMDKLEVYCIAGLADGFIVDECLSNDFGRPVPYVEHFANSGDFFARIGVFAHREATQGAFFTSNKRGHLLNEHYLAGIIRGDYCGGLSRLSQYAYGATPDDTHYNATTTILEQQLTNIESISKASAINRPVILPNYYSRTQN